MMLPEGLANVLVTILAVASVAFGVAVMGFSVYALVRMLGDD